jgi:Zn-dependent peptidase ImmA (M78 family)
MRRIMVICKPDFKKAYLLANEILVRSTIIDTFPFSITKMINELTDIQCRSFEKAKKYSIDIEDFGSESSILTEYRGKLIIFYNQLDMNERIRFSMLHEIGHYLLGHNLVTNNKDLYNKQEIETNCFAAQILMPEQVLRELRKRGRTIDINLLVNAFKVSREAAYKRIETMNKINSDIRSKEEKEYDDIILVKYKSFLDSIIPENNWFDDEYERQKERDSW